ncbi:MAG: hypothetical protein CBC02_004345 [Flavobacteriaceae bacterium TMED42]|nr:MAG: hypothetical protein CBC02_004345 [Flavobacteriaceae bacterium TMED42]
MPLQLLFYAGILLLGCNAFAQQDSLSTKYREDQFYVSFGLQLQQENISGFKQNGFSNNFQIGFVRDIPLSAKGKTAVGLGLGYAYNRLVSNLYLDSEGDNPSFFIEGNDENRQTYSSIVIPLSFRFRTSTPDRTDFWRFYGGVKYSFNFAEHYKPFYGKSIKIDFIRKNNASVFLSMGYNTWNMFFEYDFNSIYKSEVKFSDDRYPKLQTIKLGLIFYIL